MQYKDHFILFSLICLDELTNYGKETIKPKLNVFLFKMNFC